MEALDLHRRLLARLREEEGLETGEVRPIDEAAYKGEVADAPSKSLVGQPGASSPLGVLLVSSDANLDMVRRAVVRTARARAALGPDLGSALLVPIVAGSFEGRSFALWPWHRALSSSRARGLIQRAAIVPKVTSWLNEASAHTKSRVAEEALDAFWLRPLRDVASGHLFDEAMRSAAERALRRFEAGRAWPVSVLEHNDLWLGNFLLPRGRATCHSRGFIVIDWGGARIEGYPFLDLLRFARSARLPRPLLRRELLRTCATIGCELDDIAAYVLAGLGAMERTLEHFPRERFQQLGLAVYRTATGALGRA